MGKTDEEYLAVIRAAKEGKAECDYDIGTAITGLRGNGWSHRLIHERTGYGRRVQFHYLRITQAIDKGYLTKKELTRYGLRKASYIVSGYLTGNDIRTWIKKRDLKRMTYVEFEAAVRGKKSDQKRGISFLMEPHEYAALRAALVERGAFPVGNSKLSNKVPALMALLAECT